MARSLVRFSSFKTGFKPVSPLALGLLLGACIAVAPEGIRRQTDEGGAGGSFSIGVGAPVDPPPDSSTPDPHAVLGAEPAHGPFPGGGRVMIHGKGFSSKARVWFGDVEVDPSGVVAVDPGRIQVSAPPGKAGPVDLTVQNGDDASTQRTLAGGYVYDALYATPDKGPISGGTIIDIIGQGTSWDASTVARIDQKPCTSLTVKSPTELSCTVPPGTPGAKTVSVEAAGDKILVLDAYTYQDSDNGYRGGLSGAPLAGSIKVLVYDNYTGAPIPAANVIVGAPVSTALTAKTDASGVVVISDPSLNAPRTVTVAAKCHSPISFVDEPVDTVTVYLDPILSPLCASDGDPPPVGGKPGSVGMIKGELVWTGGVEFKRAPWVNVPGLANDNERRAAYVFLTAGDPTVPFYLPAQSAAITPDAEGSIGYEFTFYTGPGNRALYAIAGIEDRSKNPPSFTAYAMGVVKGVPVLPGAVTNPVYIPMNKTLDQALVMNVAAPAPGPKGPDRLRATVAVMLGNDGYALLPAGQKMPLLPLQGTLTFVGLPALDGDLVGSSYVSTARAQTGLTGTAPLSAIGQRITTSTSQIVDMDGFVGVPTLVAPAQGAKWDGKHLATTFPTGGAAIDLSVYDIQSGGGLVHWVVAVPKGSHTVELPDLSTFPDSALPPGPINIGIYGAHIDGFDYGQLRYRHLRPQGMNAYSLDYFASYL